ncbi:hypothetical protein JCM19237_4712 [Photobacterium aphoticum]|uniref:Uncharacterized protein n=1 Tax=Photobacterium aphoticum TaxID=754436 RepID=A0A090QUV5_9GAMM|nr:hypothetical protein JCM19237_4712 [Photobacterium aphoticum]
MRLGQCMLIGWLATHITMASAAGVPAAGVPATGIPATTITPHAVTEVLASSQSQARAAALATLYDHNDFRALEFNLSQLPALKQEAVRALLVDHAVAHPVLDQYKANWLQAQALRKPLFTVVEQGDGYQVTQTAFHYGTKARSQVKRWEDMLKAQTFSEQAERGELVLSEWLAGDLTTQALQRDILLAQLPGLSAQAVAQLAAQFTSDKALLWLPDNAVIAALAAASGDDGVYHLLWRRRSDQYSLAELNRLAQLAPDPQATQQLMAATINPSLKTVAYRALVAVNPLPSQTQDFLSDKLADVTDGALVATELARHGYLSWLEQLVGASRNQVLQKNIKTALSQ